jgi:hypothetical protein
MVPLGNQVFLGGSKELTRVNLETGEVTRKKVRANGLFRMGNELYYSRRGPWKQIFGIGRIDPNTLSLKILVDFPPELLDGSILDPVASSERIAILGTKDEMRTLLVIRGEEVEKSIAIDDQGGLLSQLHWSEDESSVYVICGEDGYWEDGDSEKKVGICEISVGDGRFQFRELPTVGNTGDDLLPKRRIEIPDREGIISRSLDAYPSPDSKMIAWHDDFSLTLMDVNRPMEKTIRIVPPEESYCLPDGYASLSPGVVLSGYQKGKETKELIRMLEVLTSYLSGRGVSVANPPSDFEPLVVGEIRRPKLQERIGELGRTSLLHITVNSIKGGDRVTMTLQFFDRTGGLLWEEEVEGHPGFNARNKLWAKLKKKLEGHLGEPGLKISVVEKNR